MFFNVLDKKRLGVLPLLRNFRDDFYLAGGTALALQIGHRDSVDFDFFAQKDFDTSELFEKIRTIFDGHKILKVQDEKNTLTVIIDEEVKLSFFAYRYRLMEELIETEDLRLASMTDVACMKFAAITSRAVLRDYVDIYYVLLRIKLSVLLDVCAKKLPDLDVNLVLKSLVYFDDLEKTPLKFRNNNRVGIREMQNFLRKEVKGFIDKVS